MSLQEACRVAIRRILRKNAEIENPTLGQRHRQPRPKRPRRARQNRLNIMPMSMGMMILSQFDDIRDEDGEEGEGREAEDDEALSSDEEMGLGRRRRMEEDEDEDDEVDRMPDLLQQMRTMRRIMRHVRNEPSTRVSQSSIEDEGLGEDLPEEGEENGRASNGHAESQDHLLMNGHLNDDNQNVCRDTSSSNSSDDGDMDMMNESGEVMGAIPITPSRQRYSSNTSTSTSCTSGVGTCSSVEEPPEMDYIQELEDEEDLQRDGTATDQANGHSPGNSSRYHSCSEALEEEDEDDDSSREMCQYLGPHLSYQVPIIQRHDDEPDCMDLGDDEGRVDPPPEFEGPKVTYRSCMQEKVQQLPIPSALKQFLLHYRT